MKIYFACSARGADKLSENYEKIHAILSKLGHFHLDDYKKSNDLKKVYSTIHEKNVDLYKDAMRFINAADVIVLEISTHSLSMGFLMQQALNSGKPVISLYVNGAKPVFALGIQNDKSIPVEYSLENLEDELRIALETAQDLIDVRFNFFISPAIGRYLDWISKVKKIPRSVYLRALIEHEMRENKEYQDA